MSAEIAVLSPVRIDVALVPELCGPARPHTVYLVVDVIRATTTLNVLFERGCGRVLVASDVASARAAHHHAREPKPLLAGEAGGVAPPGFDGGNSPAEYAARDVAGRDVIFATTNGTRALRACVGGGAIFAAALRNARAVAAAALAAHQHLVSTLPAGAIPTTSQARALPEVTGEGVAQQASEAGPADDPAPDIVVVCAGRAHAPSYDDTLCAGYIVYELIRLADQERIVTHIGESARIAMATLDGTLSRRSPPSTATQPVQDTLEASNSAPTIQEAHVLRQGLERALAETGAGRAIARVGLAGDLTWCAAVNAASVVPRIVGRHGDLMVMMA
jgi:phosphosulfolactate phosphohydrolase-like enzyme